MTSYYTDKLYRLKRTKVIVGRVVKLCDLCHERLIFHQTMDEVYCE